MSRRALWGVVAFLASSACPKNPATGERQLSLISRQDEIALGQQVKEQVTDAMPLYDAPELQSYVSGVGLKLAAASETPQLPWSFQVIDDASVNAFALPGGPIFITRGILTHLNSEAELAAVLGHEIGHVTARHSVNQLSKAQLAQLGLGVGSIFLPENLRGLGQIAGAGMQLLFLKYGRDDERQSDELGFRYMLRGGYDVREMKDVFVTLNRVSQQAGDRGRLPEWLSTHPNPENRVEATEERIGKAKVDFARLRVAEPEFLQHLQNVVYGQNPRQGFFRGNTFLHPELRFQIAFPNGWQGVNQASAVAAISDRQDAVVQLGLVPRMSPEQALQKFYSMEGIARGDAQVGQLNSLPAATGYFAARTEQGDLAGLVAFIALGGKTYQLVGYTPAQLLRTYDATLRQSIGSFAELTDASALNVQPARVEIVRLPREMTVREAHGQFPSTVPVETIALINGAQPETRLPANGMFKRVTGGSPASPTSMR